LNDQADSTVAASTAGVVASAPAKVSTRDFLQIFTAVMLPMFVAAIDQTLLATATPAIAQEFGQLRDTTWIALGYLIAGTITIPIYARLGDRIGRKRVLIAAISVFAVGSLACGVANSMLALTLARVLQGLGGGGLMVMSQALIGELVPPHERPRFQGYFAANFTLASLAGPMVGGYVVAHANWRWLFLVNIPLMVLAVWRVSRLASAPARVAGPRQSTDVRGALIFAAAAGVTLIWVTFVGHRFAWLSAESGLLLAVAAVLWALLTWAERSAVSPFLPVELLRDRGIAWMAATVVLFASCFFAAVFFLPIYLQLGAGVAASHSGLLLLPLTLGMVTGSTTTGQIVTRTGRPTLMPRFGLSLSASMLLALGLLQPTAWTVSVCGFLCGMGFGTVMPTAQLTIQTLAGRQRLGAAAAIVSLSRNLGAVIGTAAFGALVFGLLQGVDIAVSVSSGHSDLVIHAFRIGFAATSAVALIGAACAFRLPPIRL
jgi:EmrB/QacA subfamily drug resistance transporter